MTLPPVLVFSRKHDTIYLQDRSSGKIYFSYASHNCTENMSGDPLVTGSGGQAPAGFLTVSPPDFISDEFRREFYDTHFPGAGVFPGESLVKEWGEYEEESMGRVRFALGNPHAPEGFGDRSAWDRELLIHAGRTFDTPTHGCIRMSGDDIERFAADYIQWFRRGVVLNTLHIRI